MKIRHHGEINYTDSLSSINHLTYKQFTIAVFPNPAPGDPQTVPVFAPTRSKNVDWLRVPMDHTEKHCAIGYWASHWWWSSPSTEQGDLQWASHWCHSTAEPGADIPSQTQSRTHCTVDGNRTHGSFTQHHGSGDANSNSEWAMEGAGGFVS